MRSGISYKAIYSDDDYISHYGVLGMRWGHRKQKKTSGRHRLAGVFGIHKNKKQIKIKKQEPRKETRTADWYYTNGTKNQKQYVQLKEKRDFMEDMISDFLTDEGRAYFLKNEPLSPKNKQLYDKMNKEADRLDSQIKSLKSKMTQEERKVLDIDPYKSSNLANDEMDETGYADKWYGMRYPDI
jgi:hypothetical protein